MVSGGWMVRGRELDREKIRLKCAAMRMGLSRDSREGLKVGATCDC